LVAFGQEPEGGFTDPWAGADEDGADDEEPFDGAFFEDAEGADEPDDADDDPVAEAVAAAPDGEDAVPDVPDVPAAPVCDGSEPAASVAAESDPHPLSAAATTSTIATAVPAVGVRDTLANVPSRHERSHQNSALSKR
jgi:hypothetical protein